MAELLRLLSAPRIPLYDAVRDEPVGEVVADPGEAEGPQAHCLQAGVGRLDVAVELVVERAPGHLRPLGFRAAWLTPPLGSHLRVLFVGRFVQRSLKVRWRFVGPFVRLMSNSRQA